MFYHSLLYMTETFSLTCEKKQNNGRKELQMGIFFYFFYYVSYI